VSLVEAIFVVAPSVDGIEVRAPPVETTEVAVPSVETTGVVSPSVVTTEVTLPSVDTSVLVSVWLFVVVSRVGDCLVTVGLDGSAVVITSVTVVVTGVTA
jgi:hypothetical protein